MKNLSPIVFFVYNRPWHTQQTIEALQKNELASESDLIIYSDEAKTENEQENVDKVRLYIEQIDTFNKITIIKREKNWGLANNIIDGVTKVVDQYGKIIVIEDDIVTSPYFLKYMNEALDFYKNENKVWHISGWNYPISTNELSDVFLWRVMNCWGWATWKDRWNFFEKDTDKVIKDFSREDIKKFNLDDSDGFFKQVYWNKEKRINSWAIYWYATLFKKNGLCLNPAQSFVENIGNDGIGTSSATDMFKSERNISLIRKINFISDISENQIAVSRIKSFFKDSKKSVFQRIINRIKRITGLK